MMPEKSGCMVGSPFPAKVRTSGNMFSCFISFNFSSRAVFTSSRVGNGLLLFLWELKPHSQYRQSNVHILPSGGSRFIPSEIPNLRLFTGPNMGDG